MLYVVVLMFLFLCFYAVFMSLCGAINGIALTIIAIVVVTASASVVVVVVLLVAMVVVIGHCISECTDFPPSFFHYSCHNDELNLILNE